MPRYKVGDQIHQFHADGSQSLWGNGAPIILVVNQITGSTGVSANSYLMLSPGAPNPFSEPGFPMAFADVDPYYDKDHVNADTYYALGSSSSMLKWLLILRRYNRF